MLPTLRPPPQGVLTKVLTRQQDLTCAALREETDVLKQEVHELSSRLEEYETLHNMVCAHAPPPQPSRGSRRSHTADRKEGGVSQHAYKRH